MSNDLLNARISPPVDIPTLSGLLRTSDQITSRAKLIPILSTDPIFARTHRPFLSHADSLLHGLAHCRRLLELRSIHGWTHAEFVSAVCLFEESLPIVLHEGTFARVIETQGTPEQVAHWIPRCRDYSVIGCYAQTEIAHGSDVQSLETTATYDAKTQEFVVHTPRVPESCKFWIGGLGILATHALVQAQLVLADETRAGVALFIVPVRSWDTHRPLPGVTVGDVGPKAYGGFKMVDNGYLALKHVRIPRNHMLMGGAKVSPTGEYTPPKISKMAYGSMVALRAGIPMNQGWSLARGVTIAVRYCTQRRQFRAPGVNTEAQVLTYPSVAARLFPLIAKSYAYILAGARLMKLYDEVMSTSNANMLPELHALSSAVKARASWETAEGLEEARKSMGGHGYSHLGGVGTLFAQAAPAQTFEGDNYVIAQQTSRALIKCLGLVGDVSIQTIPESFRYLVEGTENLKDPDWSDAGVYKVVLEKRARYLVAGLAAEVAKNLEAPFSRHSVASAHIASAHSDVFTYSTLLSTPYLPPLLPSLFALSILVPSVPILLEAGIITSAASARALRLLHESAIGAMSIELAVALTDAFGFSNWELPGVVGREGGDIYKEIYTTARDHDVTRGEKGAYLEEAARQVKKAGEGWREPANGGSKL